VAHFSMSDRPTFQWVFTVQRTAIRKFGVVWILLKIFS